MRHRKLFCCFQLEMFKPEDNFEPIKIEQIGNNHYIARTKHGRYLQSYDSIIVFVANSGQVYLDNNWWDYSSTTSKYRTRFLNENKSTTISKIESGEYKIANLN